MAKPVNTVVIMIDGKVEVMKSKDIPWKCKGTSEVKAQRIKQEIENA